MAKRTIEVEILGDSKSLEKAFARSARSARNFHDQITGSRTANAWRKETEAIKEATKAEEGLLRTRARRASSIGPFRFAATGAAAGVGLFAATQAVRELGERLEVTGAAAFTAGGKFRNMVSALTSGSLVGAVEALTASRKKFEDFGITIEEVRKRQKDLKVVIAGLTPELQKQQSSAQALGYTTTGTAQAQQKLRDAMKSAGVQSQAEAKILRDSLIAHDALTTATRALADEQARLGQVMVTTQGQITRYKGLRPDDMPRAGRGEPVSGVRATTGGPTWRPGLTPSERRELALIGQQGAGRLPGLQERLRQLQNMRKVALTNDELLKIMTDIRNTEAEIAAIMADVAAARKAAAEAAKAAAEAARQLRLATELGWLEFALERAEATKPIKDDLKRLKDIEAYWLRRRKSEGKTLEIMQALWRTQQKIRDLGKKEGDTDPLAGLRQASTKQLVAQFGAGLGLGGAGRRRLGFNISGAQIQPIYNSIQVDGREIARAATTGQTRSGQRTANQTSGRR